MFKPAQPACANGAPVLKQPAPRTAAQAPARSQRALVRALFRLYAQLADIR